MPYITRIERRDIAVGKAPFGPGQLNYVLTTAVDEYLRRKGPLNYAGLNEVIGVVSCVQLELYRRVAAKYEDRKLEANGDVYTSK